MADQDYPDLYAKLEASAERAADAAVSFEGILGGTENQQIPVNGFGNQPTVAKRVKDAVPPLVNARVDQMLPGMVQQDVGELVPGLVNQQVPPLVIARVDEVAPGMVEARVDLLTPPLVESEVAELVPKLVPTLIELPRSKEKGRGVFLLFGDTTVQLPILQKAPRGRNPQDQMRMSVGGSVIPGVLARKLPRTPTYRGDESVLLSGSSVIAVIGDQRDVNQVRKDLAQVQVLAAKNYAASYSALQNTRRKLPSHVALVQVDGSGNEQVWVHDGTQLTQITAGGSKWLAPVVGPYNFVHMLGNKSGSLQPYTRAPRGFVLRDGLQVLHKVITGQSLGLGSRGFILNDNGEYLIQNGRRGDLFTDRPFDGRCLMFTGGPRQGVLASDVALEPIREFANALLGETIASSWSKYLRNWMLANTAADPWTLASVSAQGGVPYASLKKGTPVYTNAMAHVTKAKELVEASGKQHLVSSVSIIHGESQSSTTQQGYVDILQEWANDYRTDIVAVTGQPVPPAVFISQMLTGDPGTIPQIPLAQLQANELDHVIMIGPKYAYGYFDTYHMTADGYEKIAIIEARAERLWLAGKRWQPLKPVSVTASGNTIKVRFNNIIDGDLETPGPIGRLVLDTATITDPGNYGFTISAGTISSVALDKYGDGLIITMAANLVGGEVLSYALQPALGSPQTGNGRRGNVRDSDCRDLSSLDGQPVYNWAVATSLTINL